MRAGERWIQSVTAGSRKVLLVLISLGFLGEAAFPQACSSPTALGSGVVGTPYSQSKKAAGGSGPPFSDFMVNGPFPPGLSFYVDSTGTGTIAGVPTSAVGSPFVFAISFLDSDGHTLDACFSIAITAPVTPPSLSVIPGLLSFTGSAASTSTMQQSLQVQNPGSGSLTFNASAASSSPWIVSVSPASGSVTATTPQIVTVGVSTQGLAEGSYSDSIQISSSAGSAAIPVTLFVTASAPVLAVGVSGIQFDVAQGAGSSGTQSVNVIDDGAPSSIVNWTASNASTPGVPSGNFLTITPPSGQSSPGNASSLAFSLNGNASNLVAGAYYQLVQIADPNSQNSPQYVTAVLNVVPSTQTLPPELAPAGLVFSGPLGQPVASRQFTLSVSSTSFIGFTAAASTPPGPTWLHVTPTSGAISSATPAVMTVSITTNGLLAGVYNGTVDLTTDAGTFSENVTLILALSNPTPAISVHRDAAVGGCSPTRLVLTETGVPANFSVPAGWPTNLAAIMNDDCGNAIGGGTVVASFTNGDPPLTLSDQGQGGQYAGTWQPSSSLANMTIVLNGTKGTLTPAASQLTGSVLTNSAPVLSPNGIANNLNPRLGGALAPGTVAGIYGAGLSAFTGSPSTVPLPTAFQNTQLVVGGLLAPLYYVSGQQLVAQIPFEIAPGQKVAAVGVVNGQLTLPVSVSLAPMTPGVAALADGTLIAQHSADYSLVTASSPAHPGETLIMYLVGMGATNPPVKSGVAAPGGNPGDILAMVTVQPIVMVGNQNAQVAFAGLTPGGVGLYQIDFVVPLSAPTGTLSVTVSQGTVTANSTTLTIAP